MIKKFEKSIVDLDEENACNLCKKLIELPNIDMEEIFGAMSRALDTVGRKYEDGEFFLSELIIVGEIIKDMLQIIEPIYKREEEKLIATVVLATVRGDLHDIGKNIFAMLLQSSDFKIIDLGVDVKSEDIIEAVKENNADILGLSLLLTTIVPELENIVGNLKKANLRDNVKIIIGGAAINEKVVINYGIDAWGKTAVEGVKICKQWIM